MIGAWNEVPEAHWGVIQPGRDELHPFEPTRVEAPTPAG
jgi:glutamine amidotransferase